MIPAVIFIVLQIGLFFLALSNFNANLLGHFIGFFFMTFALVFLLKGMKLKYPCLIAFIYGAVSAVVIEIVQHFTYRGFNTADIVDIAVNIAGVVVFIVAAKVLKRLIKLEILLS